MPIAGGFLEFAGAVARGHGLNVLGITLGRLQESGSAREFFRIESAEIVDQDIQRPTVADDVVRREDDGGVIGSEQNHLAAEQRACGQGKWQGRLIGDHFAEAVLLPCWVVDCGKIGYRHRCLLRWVDLHYEAGFIEAGAESIVALDQAFDGARHFLDGDIARKTHRHGLVVGGRQTFGEARGSIDAALRNRGFNFTGDGGCGCRALLGGDGRDARPHTTAGF